MIVASTLLSDAKYNTRLTGLPAMLQLKGDIRFYVNIESEDHTRDGKWKDVFETLKASNRPYDVDFWKRTSSWHKRLPADQDTSRLEPICIARNMARTYALNLHASHLLFVDADVVVYPNGLEQLLKLDVPLCGGLVPGRGAHSMAQYVFGQEKRERNLIYCVHATLGYCLIRRDLFEVVSFRYGPALNKREEWMSEDPNFSLDAKLMCGVQHWLIDMNVRAKHLDDPNHPLTLEEAVTNYNVN